MNKKNDKLIKMPKDAKYYLLSMQYTDDNGKMTVGNVRVINNKFVFEGDVEKSANMFFNVTLKKLVDDYLKVRAEYTEKPYLKRMERECFLSYEGNKSEIDEFGYSISGENLDCTDNHINADNIVVKLLNNLGYKKLVEEYDKVRKWYD